jgi:GR25 family glycosyltransferase involved in LPS biosynthesis
MYRYLIIFAILVVGIALFVLYNLQTRVSEHYFDILAPMHPIKLDEFGVVVINLDRKKDTYQRFTNHYIATDLGKMKKCARISAVDGKNIDIKRYVSPEAWNDIQYVNNHNHRYRHNQLTPGAVGCYLSHIKAYQHLRDLSYEYLMIFEDDARFVRSDVFQQLRKYMFTIPDDWDLLLMGCICHVCKEHQHHQDLKHFFLLHGYLIKKSGALKLLAHFDQTPIRQQLDSELSAMAISGKIKIVCITPQLVLQDNTNNTTSIQTAMKLRTGINPFQIQPI